MSCKNLFVCGLLALAALPAKAQENGEGTKLDNWYIGIGGGYHASFMHYSDLDDDLFPTKKPLHGGVFTIFAQGEFGNQGQYAVRPEIAITRRRNFTLKTISTISAISLKADISIFACL